MATWRMVTHHCLLPLVGSSFSPIEHVESVFVVSWNVCDVMYCSLVIVDVGQRLSVQCELLIDANKEPLFSREF